MHKIVAIAAAAVTTMAIGGGTIYANSFDRQMQEETETIAYNVVTKDDATKREGTTEVQQEGKDGSKKVQYEVTYRDGNEVGREKKSEEVIEEAQDKIILRGTKKYYTCSNGTEYESEAEKQECEKRIAWEATKECYNDSQKFNCWYDEYPGTQLHYDVYVAPTPTPPTSSGSSGSGTTSQAPKTTKTGRTGAICNDGWRSSATGSGACSHHKGVAQWLY